MLSRLTLHLIFPATLALAVCGWAHAQTQTGAAAMKSRYTELQGELNNNAYHRPLYLNSREDGGNVKGDIYAVLDYPFAQVREALGSPDRWCDILILHLNTKYCRLLHDGAKTTLRMQVGKKTEESLDSTYRVDLRYSGGTSGADYFSSSMLAEKGVGFVDCGVSGGVWGLDNGYALMCGGSDEDVAKVQPAFDALKPEGEFGFVHAGRKPGAGHYAKMVHNGMEYGIMQAYAEGWELLEKVDLVENVPETFNSWREGTVIRSWLLDLLTDAITKDPHLDEIRGWADDSGEGRWTVEEAIENAVPMPAITAALFARFVSRQDDSPAMKAIAAMRNEFGGHAVKSE